MTLPAKVRNNFVVSRFSNQDFELNSEAKILNTADSYPMVTGLAIEQNKAYLLSHSAEQILVMSTSSNRIEAAYSYSGVANAQGLTVVKGEFAVLNGVKGQNSVVFFN